jgi:hypothetical protein
VGQGSFGQRDRHKTDDAVDECSRRSPERLRSCLSHVRHDDGTLAIEFVDRHVALWRCGLIQTPGGASYPTVAFRACVMSLIAACSDSLTS